MHKRRIKELQISIGGLWLAKKMMGFCIRFTKVRLCHTTNMNMQEEPTGHHKYYMKLVKKYYDPF